MLTWNEKKPTEPGWYIWFREEYDTFRREFFIVRETEGYEGNPDWLRAFSESKPRRGMPVKSISGGVWYGPIPLPPLAEGVA